MSIFFHTYTAPLHLFLDAFFSFLHTLPFGLKWSPIESLTNTRSKASVPFESIETQNRRQ
jgi:hypothetical protein